MKTINKGSKKTQTKAVVSYVEAAGELLVVWCKLFPEKDLSVQAALESLKEELDGDGLRVTDAKQVRPDLVYLKRFSDGQWYRCKLVELLGNHVPLSALVRFIDFGDVCETKLRDLHFSDLPGLQSEPNAVKYVLDEVKPDDVCWSVKTLDFCDEKLLNQSVTLKLAGKREGIDWVALYLPSETKSFNEILVEKEMARRSSSRLDEASFFTVPLSLAKNQACYLVYRLAQDQVFLQTKKHREKYYFRKMEESLNDEKFVPTPYSKILNPGQPILAYNDEKFKNCRGLVSKMKNRDFLVYFVDYGNSELKAKDEIYELPEEYLRIPVLANECALAEGSRLDLKDLDENVELNCTFLTDTKPYKVLLRSPMCSPQYGSVSLEEGREYEVDVAHVKDIYEFYVRLKRFSKNYDLLQAQLQVFVEEDSGTMSFESDVKACAVFCAAEQKWARGLISFCSSLITPVIHVDTGRVDDMCMISAVRPLSRELVEMMPAQAIRCRLHGISASQEPAFPAEQAKEVFLKIIAKFSNLKVKVVKVDQGCAEVILVDDHDKTFSLNDKILFQIGANIAREIALPVLQRTETIYVTHFNSIREFYGQLARISMDELYQFEERLNEYGNTPPVGPPCLFRYQADRPAGWTAVGDVCCAMYPTDNRFYRGKVVAHSPTEAEVLFVDYGNSERFDLPQVKVLNAELASKPQIGFMCSAVETLLFETEVGAIRHAVFNQTLEVEIVEGCGPEGVFKVAFTNAPCNEKVLSLLQPIPNDPHPDNVSDIDPNLRFATLPFGLKERAVLIHLRNLKHLFFHLPKYQADLDHVSATAQLAAKHGEKFHGVIVRNAACLAKFSCDEVWYRAQVLNLIPGNKYVVEFVDFGNRDEVHHNDIRLIPNHLMQIPKLALECCLLNHPNCDVPEDILEDFEDEALNANFKVEFKSKEKPLFFFRKRKRVENF